jgi:glycosyltransferase involved in cell wall biosynthesis
MALGKPVMSFIRKPNEYLLAPTECPIINTNPFTLKDDLRNLLIKRNELEEIGKHGRNYIEKYFSIDGVASRLAKVYKDIGIS